MNAICGWIHARFAEDEKAASLAAMTKACRRSATPDTDLVSSASAAMMAVDRLGRVSQYQQGELLVSLFGEIRWESEELARIAGDLGSAAAASRAYQTHGADCVLHMHGPFALAVFDGTHQKGLLAIDRMGIRSLSFAPTRGGIVFGSTAAVVAAHPAIGRRLCMQGIYNYLYCENVPAPGSIYEGVTKLLPGQRLVLNGTDIRTDFYWRLNYRDSAELPEPALRAEFRRLLRECVSRTATGDAVGTFLSGGTDSSTVTGLLTELRGQPVDTYSIGFEAEGFDEMDYARITSRHFQSRAHEYYVTPRDVSDTIPLIAAACDEPFGNASAVPTYCCARMARADGKTLLLAGDGGDELFGGNERYAKQKLFEWYQLAPSTLRDSLIEPLLLGPSWVQSVPLLRKASSYVQQARIPLPDRLETYNFLERELLTDIFEPDFLKAVDPEQPRNIAREVYKRADSRSPVSRIMHLDLKETLADNDLRKVNGMCELAGIEVRYPMLDDDLVAFSGCLSPAQRVKGLQLRYFFKKALKDFLAPETIAKAKHGFGLPFGLWMQRDATLRQIAVDNLGSFKRRGYVRPDYVDRLLDLHGSAHASYFGVMIWIIMMLEQWLRAHDL
jgi:asparagine synthase (glutamine-hydrolysing)